MDMMTGSSAGGPIHEFELPYELNLLFPREREIATIVYVMGQATAEEVLKKLSDPLANCSVRSMLNRLVNKGILNRVLRGRAYIYVGALTASDSGAKALRQFASDHFGGSLAQASEAMAALLFRAPAER